MISSAWPREHWALAMPARAPRAAPPVPSDTAGFGRCCPGFGGKRTGAGASLTPRGRAGEQTASTAELPAPKTPRARGRLPSTAVPGRPAPGDQACRPPALPGPRSRICVGVVWIGRKLPCFHLARRGAAVGRRGAIFHGGARGGVHGATYLANNPFINGVVLKKKRKKGLLSLTLKDLI